MKNELLLLCVAGVISMTRVHPMCNAAETPEATDRFLLDFTAALTNVTSVYSEFVQERQMAILSEPLVSKGVILFSKPGQVRWETTEPYRSILIASHNDVAQFEWMNDGWSKLKLGYAAAMRKIMENLTLVWSGRLGEQKKDYEFALVAGDEMVLTMSPLDAGVREFINAIEMHIDKASFAATRVVLREPGGDITTIRMQDQRINSKLPSGCFDLDAPQPLEKIQQVVRSAK